MTFTLIFRDPSHSLHHIFSCALLPVRTSYKISIIPEDAVAEEKAEEAADVGDEAGPLVGVVVHQLGVPLTGKYGRSYSRFQFNSY